MHHSNSKHEPENSPWKRASFDVAKTARVQLLRTPCEKNAAALAAFFDGESQGEETRRAALHLEECARCRALLHGWQHTRDLLLSTPPAIAPPILLPRVLAAWRLAAPSFAGQREIAPPPELAREILRATCAAPPTLATPSRAFVARRAASKVLALAMPACLIFAAFSLQSDSVNEAPPDAKLRVATPPTFAATKSKSAAQPIFESAARRRAKNAVASTRALASDSIAVSNAVSVSDTDAKSAAPREISPAKARVISFENSAPRDVSLRVEKIAFREFAAPRFDAVKLSATTGRSVLLPLSKKSPPPIETSPAPRPMKTATTSVRRGFSSAPRLTSGAPMMTARVRLASPRITLVSAIKKGENAPRVTRPDAGLRHAESGITTAELRSFDRSVAAPPRAVSTLPPRLAYAPAGAEAFNETSGDALDEMRAATNSYRAALDDETDGFDGNI